MDAPLTDEVLQVLRPHVGAQTLEAETALAGAPDGPLG